MSRLKRLSASPRARLIGLVTVAGIALSACAGHAPQTTLQPKGPAADKINNLSTITFAIAGVVFVLVEFGVLFVAWKFRKRKDDDGTEMPHQLHGNTKAEIGWTALPAVILVALAIPTVGTVLDLAKKPTNALEVRVVGQQWWWSYDYDINGNGIHPDNDVTKKGIENPEEYKTDVETASELVIPVGRPVYLDITSRDVIHSFWIPALNGKKDAVPGRTHHLTLEADAPGTYIGQCTEFCGLSHAYMRMSVRALPPDEFDQWVQNQLKDTDPGQLTGLAAQGEQIFAAQCTTCHKIDGVNDNYNGAAQVSGMAPNLTHFASRGIYAGGIFHLWADQNGDDKIETSEIGGQLERNQLEAWLRNPPGQKPLAPTQNRGMPNLGLSEADIDALVAYLTTLD